MAKYNKNTREFRLLSEIVSKYVEQETSQDEVIRFVKTNYPAIRRPKAIINDIIDNGFGTMDEEGFVHFTNKKGGKKEEKPVLSPEMKAILEVVSKEGTSRTEVLNGLKQKGFGRIGRSLLNQARKDGLIRGTVINKVPTYILVVED